MSRPFDFAPNDHFVFTANNTSTTSANPQPWLNSPDYEWVEIYALSAGGGGGGGQTGATSVTGGGGGAAGSYQQLIYPAMLLPRVLYVTIGLGGGGGGAGANGTAGGLTEITLNTSTNSPFFRTGSAAGGLSGAGGGTGGAPATLTIQPARHIFQVFNENSGLNGGNGTTAPQSGSKLGFQLFEQNFGGGGGGGINASGVGQNGSTIALPDTKILASLTNSRSGYSLSRFPLTFNLPGAGGAANPSGTGGSGGDGGFGCGGGGGGAGVTGGSGGHGGDGLVIINVW